MALTPGTRLGQYEIIAAIGAGGMGEVYRAHDGQLDRDVAVKVLSPELASDPAALARFEHEALSVARLSHPNILAIHQFAREGGVAFVVTELVDGDTLRARLDHGPLPVRRAVAYALQIARGIAAAHARGVVHRDLKPENVMVTRDDHVKILDFGLAKDIARGQNDLTRVAGHATSAGTVLGTFGYMAPEQVRGVAVDHRADIFAFGAVLYEMLSGTRAFAGETAADTMSAVLTKDPPELDATRLAIPAGLDRVVRRCLEKPPELRFQSTTDLAFALETLSTVSSSATAAGMAAAEVAVTRSARRGWLPWSIAALALIAAGASWWGRRPDAREQPWTAFTRISEAAGEEKTPSVSPDGNTVVYAIRAGGSWDIYSQRVGGRNATPTVSDPQIDEGGPAFSPDGTLIAFHRSDASGGIFVAGATGESVRRITDAGFDPAWSPDGTRIAFATEEVVDPSSRLTESTLYAVEVAGGPLRKVVDGDAVQPSWSPSGRRIVYWSNRGGQRDLFTVDAAGGPPVPLTNDPAIDWCPIWSPDGRYVYFSSDRGTAMSVWRIAVDEASGAPRGAPELVIPGVQASAALPSFSRNGARLAFRSRVSAVNPVAIPFDPVTLRAGMPVVLDTQNNIRIPSGVSPDGKQLAYFSIGEPQEDLFIGPVGGPMRRVIDDAARDRAPVFMPDGRSLVFYSNRESQWGIWIVNVDGGALRKIQVPAMGAVYAFPSPRGDELAFVGTAGIQAYTAPVSPPLSPPRTLENAHVDGKAFAPSDWSPEGTRLTGTLTSASGRPAGVAVYDIAARRTVQLSADETYAAKWLPDGRRIVYFAKNGHELVVVDATTGARSIVDVRLPGPSIGDMFAITGDGRTIYYGAMRSEADIWIAERR